MGLERHLGALVASLLLSVSSEAAGRAEAESGYTKAQTYNAALRYLRVDLDYEVTERDPDAAYLIFQYVPPGRKKAENGAIEIVETPKTVKIFVQLPQMPSYHEQVLKDGLMKKLGDEYGAPPPKAKPPRDPDDKTPENPPDDDGEHNHDGAD